MDNANNFSFFDLFGDAAAEYKPAEVKKPEPKKDTKKETKRSNVRTYKLPLKVVTGVFPDFSIKEEDTGKDTIAEGELHEIIGKRYEQFSKELAQLDVKGLLCKVYNKSYAQFLSKQKRTIDDGWRITLNGFSLPLPEGLEIDEDIVKGMWETEYPSFKGIKVKCLFDPVGKVIVPLIESDKLDETIKLPATYFIFGQEEFVVEGSSSAEIEKPEKVEEKAEDVEEDAEDDIDEDDSEDIDSEEESANQETTETANKPAAHAKKTAKKFTVNDLRLMLTEKFGGMTFAVAKCNDG